MAVDAIEGELSGFVKDDDGMGSAGVGDLLEAVAEQAGGFAFAGAGV